MSRTRQGRLWTFSSGRSRTLAALFLAVVAPPAATLVWLGLQLLQQDRALWAQRELEERQAAALVLSHSLEQSLNEAERWLSGGPVPDGAARFHASSQGIQVDPPSRVLWLPSAAPMQATDAKVFVEAEALEYQGAADRALVRYQERARSRDPAVRAGALLRVARIHRRERRWDATLLAYRALGDIRHIAVDGMPGMPADLLGRRALCSVLEESGHTEALGREAAALEADFVAGRWTLDQPAWELVADQVARWTGHPMPVAAERRTFSAVADWLWSQSPRSPGDTLPSSSRQLIFVHDTPVTLITRAERASAVTIALLPSVLQTWSRQAMDNGPGTRERLSVLAESGRILLGPAPHSGPATVKRAASETGLPWTLVLSPGDSSRQTQELANRRRLLSLGLAAIVLLLAGGSYLLWRVMQRELAVARLQTDFVSAVSHEFRTPLASLRHVTELLTENDDIPRTRRTAFYEALGRNTERLHRLVESLLDFARMEGGKKPYDLQPVDAGALAAQVIADFKKDVGPDGVTIELDSTSAVEVRADTASLTHALWNLLDNAVKYSPGRGAVRVSVHRQADEVAISVRDEGLGIGRHEQKEIFHRFVRGEKASELGIKGTGLGLAMVSHIVHAHGGAIALESEEGAGSTFTILLPAQAAGEA